MNKTSTAAAFLAAAAIGISACGGTPAATRPPAAPSATVSLPAGVRDPAAILAKIPGVQNITAVELGVGGIPYASASIPGPMGDGSPGYDIVTVWTSRSAAEIITKGTRVGWQALGYDWYVTGFDFILAVKSPHIVDRNNPDVPLAEIAQAVAGTSLGKYAP
jgi:hypothetical protein